MDPHRVTGTAKDLGGRAQETLGSATGDWKNQVEGKLKQAEGQMEDLYGQARDTAVEAAESVRRTAVTTEEMLRETIEARPYTAVVAALALGWVIGRMSKGH